MDTNDLPPSFPLPGQGLATGLLDMLGGDGEADQPGDCLEERYVLERVLGEGSFGVVWRAQQTQPVQRKVAVKILKWEADISSQRDELLARFEAERQTLALLRHEGITHVLDAGTTEDGRPFFVMELVEGVPVTQWCQERRAGLRVRLEIFQKVCLAVQHAHVKMVLHRDLKPANLLVTTSDAKGDDMAQPKVIDFGIAKSLDSLGTAEGVSNSASKLTLGWLGTPCYMSPEQAGTTMTEVDARTDVFALGAVLHELLTGDTPLPKEEASTSSTEQVLRRVRDCPSPRMKDQWQPVLGDRWLTRVVRRELECIVTKALERRPESRYASVELLASDIHRCLHDEPVAAHPRSFSYLAAKFVRRHRVLAVVAVVFALGLITYVLNIRADEQLAAMARDTALQRLNEVQAARQESEKLVSFMAENLHQKLQEVGRLDLLADVNARVVDYYERPIHVPTDLPAILRLVDIRQRQARLLKEQGKFAESRATEQKTLEILTPLLGSEEKAIRIGAQGKAADAWWLISLSFNGEWKPEQALQAVEKGFAAIAMLPAEVQDVGSVVVTRANLEDQRGYALRIQKDDQGAMVALRKAESLYQQAVKAGEQESLQSLAVLLGNAASLLQGLGQLPEAVAEAAKSVDEFEKLAIANPDRIDLGERLLGARVMLAKLLVKSDDKEGANTQLDEALATGAAYLKRDPSNEDLCIAVSDMYEARAEEAEQAGQLEMALELRKQECAACGKPLFALGPSLRTLQPLWTRQKSQLRLLLRMERWAECGASALNLAEITDWLREECIQARSRLLLSPDDPGWKTPEATAKSLQIQCAQYLEAALQYFNRAGDTAGAQRATEKMRELGETGHLSGTPMLKPQTSE